MMRRLVVACACLVLAGVGGCTSSGASTPPVGETTATATARTPSAAEASVPQGLADGKLPTDCSYVSDAERLSALGVATNATTVSTPASTAPMPTSEAQAQEEDRVWPGLGCVYASPDAEQEATILVMPDTSPFFTRRQTTTCLPTFGKGEAVDLGGVSGWYCPTTNETPGEWVSFVHHGRLVTVNRTSRPTGDSPYRAVLVSYASWLAQRI
jgi:S-formylglutathione hydrolase FrmB